MPVVNLVPLADVFVAANAPTLNLATDTRLIIGNDNSGGAGDTRIWLLFDLSAYAGATINSASITLETYYNNNHGIYPPTILVECANCTDISWTESSITWNNAPNGSCGSVLDSKDYFANFMKDAITTYTGLGASVQAALASGKVAFRLKMDDESHDDLSTFLSDSDYPSGFPYLTLDYTPGAASSKASGKHHYSSTRVQPR